MFDGSPSRSALLARQTLAARPSRQEAGSPGQHRQPPQRRAVREPQHTMQMLMSGLGAFIMLAICGLSGFFIVVDERRGHDTETSGEPDGGAQAISTRAVDAVPLSLSEVFPGPEIRLVAGAAPYTIGMTHIDTDCPIATTGSLGAVLTDQSCSQVVRASLTAPYGGYQVTAGIFNLADESGAARAGEQTGRLVETGGGTFAAMAAGGPGTDPLIQPISQVGWHERGHYLLYCVIARPDGQVVRDDDPYARRITADLVQSYLGERIIGARASGKRAP